MIRLIRREYWTDNFSFHWCRGNRNAARIMGGKGRRSIIRRRLIDKARRRLSQTSTTSRVSTQQDAFPQLEKDAALFHLHDGTGTLQLVLYVFAILSNLGLELFHCGHLLRQNQLGLLYFGQFLANMGCADFGAGAPSGAAGRCHASVKSVTHDGVSLSNGHGNARQSLSNDTFTLFGFLPCGSICLVAVFVFAGQLGLMSLLAELEVV
mmetsp:Transcript_131015/g.195250  ORF Transcript_131015/g.195250 Transcript_131015/m.195250 type:complete len:209 (+) Transcript_131015:135-761(+)